MRRNHLMVAAHCGRWWQGPSRKRAAVRARRVVRSRRGNGMLLFVFALTALAAALAGAVSIAGAARRRRRHLVVVEVSSGYMRTSLVDSEGEDYHALDDQWAACYSVCPQPVGRHVYVCV